MINPIEYSDFYKDIMKRNDSYKLFVSFKSDKFPNYKKIGFAIRDSIHEINRWDWAIELYGDQKIYVVNCKDTESKEIITNYIISNYPEQFEYLLFHPEWLR